MYVIMLPADWLDGFMICGWVIGDEVSIVVNGWEEVLHGVKTYSDLIKLINLIG